jgi:hypothetical protein
MHHPEHGVQRYNRKSTGEDLLKDEGVGYREQGIGKNTCIYQISFSNIADLTSHRSARRERSRMKAKEVYHA